MTMRSLAIFGVCALAGAVATMVRRASDAQGEARRRSERCERLLGRLDARCANFR